MTPDTAEVAVAAPPVELAASTAPGGLSVRWKRLRTDAAVRDCWRALWVSRAVVLLAGVGAVAAFGVGRARSAFVPPGVTSGFGWLGDLLAAPVARWDAAWYLVIAHYGYRPDLGPFTASRTAFFPLYPLGVRGISELGVPPIAAGVALSMAALAAALYGIHRLSTLELGSVGKPSPSLAPQLGSVGESPPSLAPQLGSVGKPSPSLAPCGEEAREARGREAARLAVLVTALAPMAFYLSAVYSESLYLALSVGVFWCARRGRWASAAGLGALASATRSAGLVLVVPILILYLYGPREDREPDFPTLGAPSGPRVRAGAAGGGGSPRLGRPRPPSGWWRPRYRVRANILWVAALPVGVGAYMAYLALAGGSALMPFHAQEVWNRQFAGPFVGVWDGARAAFEGARQLLSFQRAHVYFKLAGGSPFVDAGHNLMLFAFLLAALPMVLGVLRRLPLAYGAYVLAALALPLSYPVAPEPLMSLPRFEVVLFPLAMWAGAWLAERPRARLPALAGSALLMAFFVGEFATWHWVA